MIKVLKTRRHLGLSILGAAALLTTSVAAVSVSAEQAPRGVEDVPREETVIFDTDSASLANPFNFNYMVPGNDRNHGYHQAMMEPLFILNYETGEIEPWLGLEYAAERGPQRLDVEAPRRCQVERRRSLQRRRRGLHDPPAD